VGARTDRYHRGTRSTLLLYLSLPNVLLSQEEESKGDEERTQVSD